MGNPYEDYGAEIKSQRDGYYTLLRMIKENTEKDYDCFLKGIPPAGDQGAHKLKSGKYQYPGILKENPIDEWNESLILKIIKDAI